jgi:hypothetical protein
MTNPTLSVLDLGERNPNGTPFYRTADFHFKK